MTLRYEDGPLTFNDTFNYLMENSLHPRTLVKYRLDFQDYWKEVVQECCLNYYGGRYKRPRPTMISFDDEFSVIEEKAKDWFYRGIE